MATSPIIKTIKEKYPQKLVLIRIGNFYHAHGKDAYIMSYLFGYRLKNRRKRRSNLWISNR